MSQFKKELHKLNLPIHGKKEELSMCLEEAKIHMKNDPKSFHIETHLLGLTLPQLKIECKRRGLSINGKKQELQS